MFKYRIIISCFEDGIFYCSKVEFKNVDLAVSHLLSAMDCGKTVTFEPIKPDDEN